jgi:hypothetical protein
MQPASLQPDCTSCCALCCVAPAFDADQGFGFDKAAHEPCRNLRADFKCNIHHTLIESGFPGCKIFDCHGAGQRTQQLFNGASWQDSPELAVRMFDAYSRMRSLHELLVLLNAARTRFPQGPVNKEIDNRFAKIEQTCQSSEAVFAGADIDGIKRETLQLIRGLRHADLEPEEPRVESFIHDFEAGLIPKCIWTHRTHMIAGFWYLSRHPTDALARLRSSIRQHNEAVGTVNSNTSGYHETITRLYLEFIQTHIATNTASSFSESLGKLLDSPAASSQWPLVHYSAERLFSTVARLQWVEPDLLPRPHATAAEGRKTT